MEFFLGLGEVIKNIPEYVSYGYHDKQGKGREESAFILKTVKDKEPGEDRGVRELARMRCGSRKLYLGEERTC